jgi:hypothetical protein
MDTNYRLILALTAFLLCAAAIALYAFAIA